MPGMEAGVMRRTSLRLAPVSLCLVYRVHVHSLKSQRVIYTCLESHSFIGFDFFHLFILLWSSLTNITTHLERWRVGQGWLGWWWWWFGTFVVYLFVMCWWCVTRYKIICYLTHLYLYSYVFLPSIFCVCFSWILSLKPSKKPSKKPTRKPSKKPTRKPSKKPTKKPTFEPWVYCEHWSRTKIHTCT